MTREQYIDEFFKKYDLVSTLSNKNGGLTLRMRHKIHKRDIVLHSFEEDIELYRLLCHVRCDNLPEIYDYIRLDDGIIVLEEFIEGTTLADAMFNQKYDKKKIEFIIVSLCAALKVIHKFGYVHRDIKPENIILANNGNVVLIDFNASRSIKLSDKDTVIMGTIGYAAPEQLGITESDTRTDIYSLGILINVLNTGLHPCLELCTGKHGRIVNKCTSINPNQRYKSVYALENEL